MATIRTEYFIGFVNPLLPCADDGIANDETAFEANDLTELAKLYVDFCQENNIPCNTVKYIARNPVCEERGFITC